MSTKTTILAWILQRTDGATDQEVQSRLRLRHESVSARRNELRREGLVKNSGKVRRTSSGRFAKVWVAGRDEAYLSCESQKLPKPSRAVLQNFLEGYKTGHGSIKSAAVVIRWLESLIHTGAVS